MRRYFEKVTTRSCTEDSLNILDVVFVAILYRVSEKMGEISWKQIEHEQIKQLKSSYNRFFLNFV